MLVYKNIILKYILLQLLSIFLTVKDIFPYLKYCPLFSLGDDKAVGCKIESQ